MRLGIVSDTHGHVEFARTAVRVLESLEVEQVIHCGDIGSSDVVELFHRWPTHFVLGNVDARPQAWRALIDHAGQTFHGRFGSLEIEGKRIAFLHGDDGRLLEETVACGQYDLVCYGHTHVAEQHRRGPTLVVNPGALYRAERHTIAVARLPELEVTHLAV
jgi:putative phosphoesterase